MSNKELKEIILGFVAFGGAWAVLVAFYIILGA